MTWRECKLTALQKMFSNEGAAINADDTNQDYLDAMPGAANEAMHQLATVGRPILKQFKIVIREKADKAAPEDTGQTKSTGSAETGAETALEELVLDAGEVRYKITLPIYIPRFRAVEQLLLESGGVYGQAEDWDMEGDVVLVLPGNVPGTYCLWYAAYPQVFESGTPEETVIDLAEEAAALIPLYIAGELYKEDELAMATMFRNEFEDGLAKLQQSYAASGGGVRGGYRRNTTGWW